MLHLEKTIPPHTGEKIIYAGSPAGSASSAMILLHGRGADAASMKGLIGQLRVDKMLCILPEADNFTWYPYRFIEKRELNEPGISSGLKLIDAIVVALGEQQIRRENLFLLGFSQGACLALDYTARYPDRFGGVFALSGGLIGENLHAEEYQGDLQQTPVFLGCSDRDSHIPEERVQESAAIFEKLNAAVTKKIYPNMGHTVNRDEINMINQLLSEKRRARLENTGA